MKSPTIRKITSADFTSLTDLIQEFAEFQKSANKMSNSADRMRVEEQYINGFVAETREGLVGYAIYNITYNTWSGKGIYLDDLYVKPAFQQMGLGRNLMQEVMNEGVKNGCHRMRWLVSKWNDRAQKFYEKLGASLASDEMTCDLILNPPVK